MKERLSILISTENKKFVKRCAIRQNKSVSKLIDDLLATVKQQSTAKKQKDEWIKQTAGAYHTSKKDILKELFKGIFV